MGKRNSSPGFWIRSKPPAAKHKTHSVTFRQLNYHGQTSLPQVLPFILLTLFWTFQPAFLPLAFKPPPDFNQLVTVEGTYLDKKGNPIADAHTIYQRGGATIGEDYTDENGNFSMQVLLVQSPVPWDFPKETLTTNRPNPYLDQTWFTVNVEDRAELMIHDMAGRLVKTMEFSEPGVYELQWQGEAAGAYICSVVSKGHVETKKMLQVGAGQVSLDLVSFSGLSALGPYKNASTVVDSLKFLKDNTTPIAYPFELEGDTVVNQVGNPGPYEFDPIQNADADVGDTLSWYLMDYLYNDEETNAYTPLSPNTWVSNDTLYFHAASQGTQSVQLNVTDLTDATLSSLVDFYVYVNSVNQAPVAVDDNANTNEDVAAVINVLGNDYDADGNILVNMVSTENVLQPQHGSTSVNPFNGKITYTSDANWFGSDAFEYVIWDDGTPSLSDTAFVYVNVAPVNDAPVALPDNASTPYQTAVTIPVVSNDSDPDDPNGGINPATLNNEGLLQPSNGTITIDNVLGKITYTPDNGFSGTDVFEYQIGDNGVPLPVLYDVASVTVNVGSPSNLPPVAVDDDANANEDNLVTVDVLVNDYDPDGSLVPSSVSTAGLLQPQHGSTVINPSNGKITFTPIPNWYGIDSFEYKVGDNGNPQLFDIALVTVNYASVNDAPVAVDDAANVDEDGSVTIDVLLNDSDPYDPNGAVLPGAVSIDVQPLHGSVSVNLTTGSITYTPAPNYHGSDSFVYKVGDNGNPQLFDNAAVSLIVNSVNDAPVAVDDVANVDEDGSVTIDVLLNDSDPNDPGGALVPSSVSVTTQPLHGTTSVNPTNGKITYTPAANYFGSDNFVYQVGDNGVPQLFDNAAVSLTVNSVNDAPVAVDDSGVVDEDGSVTIDVLLNDSDPYDPGGAVLPGAVSIDVQPQHGSVSVNLTTGSITYTPAPNYFGSDSFVYKVGDNGVPQLFDTALVTVTVNSVNDAPVAIDDAAVTDENVPVTIDVLLNDSDPNDPGGAVLPDAVSVTTQPSHGTTSVNPTDGKITYTPANGYSGADSFAYQVGDNGTPQLFDNANVSVTVNNVAEVYFKVMDLMMDTLLPGATLHIGSNSYVLSEGDTTMNVPAGTFEVHATHPDALDGKERFPGLLWPEFDAIQRPAQAANVEQRAAFDYTSPITFTGNDDTLTVYKVMEDFGMGLVIDIIGSGPQGQTIRFGDDDLNAPAWMDLNYTPPTTYTRDWLQYWLLEQLPPATKGKLNMVWQENTTQPTVPYLQMKIQSGVPAQNGTNFDGNYEITDCHAYYPNNSQSTPALGMEVLQAVGKLNDIGGSSPPILSYQNGQWVINHTGQECFHLLYNYDAGTKFWELW